MFSRSLPTRVLSGAVVVAMAVAVSTGVSPVFAQSKVPAFKATRPPFATVPMERWVGEKVLFQRALPADQAEAYASWSTAPMDGVPEAIFLSADATYEDLAGKTATIKSVETVKTDTAGDLGDTASTEETGEPDPTSNDATIVTIELDDSGKRYRSLVEQDAFPAVVFLRDVDAAKKAYTGKTLWAVGGYMTTDATAGKPVEERYIPLDNFEKVTVVDAAPGLTIEAPVQIIFKRSSGQVGYVPVYLSRTNVASDDTVSDADTFEGCFVRYDPQMRYPFTPAIWKSIRARNVTPGMTPLQVVMTYLPPDVVKKPSNPAQGDMVYIYNWEIDGVVGSRRIYFKKNHVIADKTEEKKAARTRH